MPPRSFELFPPLRHGAAAIDLCVALARKLPGTILPRGAVPADGVAGLVAAGVLRRGKGGVALARPPDRIQLWTIVDAAEAALRDRRSRDVLHPLGGVWREAERRMIAVLKRATLVDVARRAR